MLQQTQVTAVIGYYAKFMRCFPNIHALAGATQDEVLQHWSGLGYYSRARNLHTAAQKIMDDFAGVFPTDFDDILSLPGVGRSTAAAISTFALNQPQPILDGNVKRVFARYFNISGWPSQPKVEAAMWQIAARENPNGLNSTASAIAYTQGLMDLGATLCTRTKPNCPACPVNTGCAALANNTVKNLPTPKPRKTIPERSVYLLVYKNANDIMLEKRANTGVWGGLWSFPETVTLANSSQEKTQLLAKFTHTFTHFKLHIQPVLIQAGKQENAPNSLWLGIDEAIEAAIPTPVRKILLALKSKKAA